MDYESAPSFPWLYSLWFPQATCAIFSPSYLLAALPFGRYQIMFFLNMWCFGCVVNPHLPPKGGKTWFTAAPGVSSPCFNQERAVKVEWKAEDEDENGEKQDANHLKMKSFLQAITKAKDGKKVVENVELQKRKRRRFDYFEKVQNITTLHWLIIAQTTSTVWINQLNLNNMHTIVVEISELASCRIIDNSIASQLPVVTFIFKSLYVVTHQTNSPPLEWRRNLPELC